MDTITHVISGGLLGKAYFSNDQDTFKGRVAVLAVTFGSVFPDSDIIVEAFSHDPLAIAKIHRGFTHSFVGLPIFAVVFAWLTRWVLRRWGRDCPSTAALFIAYAVGIASHIVLDGMTSFGTRMWMPISNARVAWDLLFIIDFAFSAILLVPQIAAWVYRRREKSIPRAVGMWVLGSVGAWAAWGIARAVQFPFSLWSLLMIVILLAGLFFLPLLNGRGFRIGRAAWCRGGVYAAVAYLIACGFAHHAALKHVRTFAEANHIAVQRMGALPIPPTLFDWTGLIRAEDGVYQARFDLLNAQPPVFISIADSPPNPLITEARALKDVRTYFWFARFPMIHFVPSDDRDIVEFSDLRFFDRSGRRPPSFVFQVVFDKNGKVVEEGWVGTLTYPHPNLGISPATKGSSN